MKPAAVRLAQLERELADLREEQGTLNARLQGEREVIQQVANLKQQIEETRHQVEEGSAPG